MDIIEIKNEQDDINIEEDDNCIYVSCNCKIQITSSEGNSEKEEFIRCKIDANGNATFLSEPITVIPNYFFRDIKKLKHIEIPISVKKIGNGAFLNCYGLKEVIIDGNNLTSIGNKAFFNCQKLEEFNFPNSIEQIGKSTFFKCESLKKVDLSSCTKLSKINIGCFSNCNELEMVELPEGITSLFKSCFYNCKSLIKINLPSVCNIGESAFENCEGLKEIVMMPNEKMDSNNNLSVGNKAFKNCINLNKIEGYDSIQYCVTSFTNCPLRNILLENANAQIKNEVKAKFRGIGEITIPKPLNKAFINGNMPEDVTDKKRIDFNVVTKKDMIIISFRGTNSKIEMPLRTYLNNKPEYENARRELEEAIDRLNRANGL